MTTSARIGGSLWLLALVNLLNYVDRSVFTVVLEPIKAELSLTDANVGLLVGAFSLLYAGLGVPLGVLADRVNRVRLLSIAVALWSLMTAAGGFARNFVELFVARVGVGIGEAACLPVGVSIIGDSFSPTRRSAAVAVFNGSALIGSVLGFVLMGYLADQFGWRIALMLVGFPGILLAVVVSLRLAEPIRRGASSDLDRSRVGGQGYAALLKNRTFLIWLAALPTLSLGLNVVNLWGPAYFTRSFGLSLSDVGLRFGLTYGVGATAGTLLGGWLSLRLLARDRRWDFWLPALGAVLAIPIYRAAFATDDADVAFAFTGLGAFLACLGYGSAVSVVQWVAGPSVRGAAVGLGMGAAALVGLFVGPWLVGTLADTYATEVGSAGLGFAIRSAVLAFAPAALLFWLGSRFVGRDAIE